MRRRAAIVWAGRLDVGPAQLAQYEALLSAGGRAHAVLYRTTADRSRYPVRRAVLQIGLGRTLDRPEYSCLGYDADGSRTWITPHQPEQQATRRSTSSRHAGASAGPGTERSNWCPRAHMRGCGPGSRAPSLWRQFRVIPKTRKVRGADRVELITATQNLLKLHTHLAGGAVASQLDRRPAQATTLQPTEHQLRPRRLFARQPRASAREASVHLWRRATRKSRGTASRKSRRRGGWTVMPTLAGAGGYRNRLAAVDKAGKADEPKAL